MPRLKSKEFKKKYAVSTSNVTGKGVWSGRGIGIPVAGAVDGSGDGSKYLGRPRRPRYQGDQGSPSQSADSGFSSHLARVNKDWDVEYEDVMFPWQEEEDDDIYPWEDVTPVVSKKIPRSFKVMGNVKFHENTEVERSRYRLSDLFDFEDRVDEGIGTAAITKGIPALLKSVGLAIPGVDIVLGSIIGGWNVYKVRKRSDKLIEDLDVPENAFLEALSADSESAWLEIMSRIQVSDTEIIKEDFDDFLDALKSLFLTIAQSYDSILAAAGIATGPGVAATETVLNIFTAVAGFVAEIVPIERWIFDMSTDGAAHLERLFEFIRSQGPEAARELDEMAEEGGEGLTAIILDPVRTFRRLGDFYTALHKPEELTPRQAVTSAAKSRSKEEIMRTILQGDSTMSESALRKFIRESIYPDVPAYSEAQPTGFAYRDVPTVITKYDKDQEFDVLDDYDDFSVAYNVGGGVIAYQARNKLSEKALRRMIRRDISTLLSETQKKKS